MKTQLPKTILNNLRFLLVEVDALVTKLQKYIVSTGNVSPVEILDRSGYVFNLKVRIHNDCYQHMLNAGNNEKEIIVFRSIDIIANNLERIADLCRDCTYHFVELSDKSFLYDAEYRHLLDCVVSGINPIEPACRGSDSQLALKIADSQQTISSQCQKLVDRYTNALKISENTDDLVAVLFVVKSINNMGDALLKISEAILSGTLGQPITIDRYHSLSGFVGDLRKNGSNKKLEVETIAETRSGSAISGISEANKEDIIAIFKDGKKSKLKEELQSVESWHEIYPGIAPKILSYRKQGRSAALLIEHLEGKTFEGILLEGNDKLLNKSLKKLMATLQSIWKKTRRKKQVNAHYMQQLHKRLPDVYAIHPGFQQQPAEIAGIKIPSFDRMLNKARKLEEELSSPFSVYIHGDFNTDNIIYDIQQNKINFIDLHRSSYMDYVQDVSVFMVSNYRLQALDHPHRQRVLRVNQAMYEFSADFARKHNDDSFELRLALGLARSLATSTRFTLDKTLARAMFYRARYLIEQVSNLKKKHYSDYRVPVQETFLG